MIDNNEGATNGASNNDTMDLEFHCMNFTADMDRDKDGKNKTGQFINVSSIGKVELAKMKEAIEMGDCVSIQLEDNVITRPTQKDRQ